MAITTAEFAMLVDRAANGTPAGPGWGVFKDVLCQACGARAVFVAAIGTRGKTCACCGAYDPDHRWLPEDTGIGWDGAFLNPVGWQDSRLITP